MTATIRIRAALAPGSALDIRRRDVAELLVERDYLAGQVERIAGSWLVDQFMLADRRIRAAERVLHSYDNARGHVDVADLAEDIRTALRGEA